MFSRTSLCISIAENSTTPGAGLGKKFWAQSRHIGLIP
jgi:hypothetical protein